MRELIVLCGLPFSGKTTYARAREAEGARVISRDAIVEELLRDHTLRERLRAEAATIADPISKLYDSRIENAFNDLLTREYVRHVGEMIRRIDTTPARSPSTAVEGEKPEVREVIVDGMHLQPLSRSFVAEFPDRHRVALVFPTPVDTCIQRFATEPQSGFRATLTPGTIRRLALVFEVPTMSEGFSSVITVKSKIHAVQ